MTDQSFDPPTTSNRPTSLTRFLKPPKFGDPHQDRLGIIAQLLFLAALTCGAALVLYFLTIPDWTNATILVLFTLMTAVAFFILHQGDLNLAFTILAIGSLLAMMIGSLYSGNRSTGLQAVYTILVMIAAFSQHRPGLFVKSGIFIIVWMGILYILELNGFYAEFEPSFNVHANALFMVVNIAFNVLLLQMTIQNLISANRKLEAAKEAAVEAKIEAEYASKAKSIFLANMSHELRTPLNAIIGYSQGLIEETEINHYARLDGENLKDVERIELAGRHLLNIISDILDISKIEANEVDVELSHFNINTLVIEVIDTVQHLIKKNNNVISIELSCDQEKLICTDRLKIKQILLNLLSNAAKYTENGQIKVVIDCVADDAGHPLLKINVTDTGIGIPEDQLATIFDAFRQVDNSLARNFQGTGLGLAITQRVVQLLNGTIEVTSKLNHGSSFVLRIPLGTDVYIENEDLLI